MKNISAPNQAALDSGELEPRDFLWIVARNRSTGATQGYGFWSDIGTRDEQVVNPDTGLPELRTWVGSGTLIQIDAVVSSASIVVNNVTIKMSQLADAVNEAIRDYDIKQGRVEIYRGLYNPDTHVLVAPAECRFVGFVDNVDIVTPEEGGEGDVEISCVSHTQEMTRANPDTRSHESQQLRHAGDDFYKDTGTVGEWEIWWGKKNGKIPSEDKKPTLSGDPWGMNR